MGNIIGQEATPTELETLRQQALQLREEAKAAGQESQAAWQAGNKAKAKELSEKKKQLHLQADQIQKQVSQGYFRQNNKSHPFGTVDLHQLYVNEALKEVARRARWSILYDGKLNVITGKGLHSEGQIAKIKPAVEQYASARNWTFSSPPNNSGIVLIELSMMQRLVVLVKPPPIS